jgi:hypothetical protein
MNLEISKGIYHCFRCGSKGSWFDFKNKIIEKFYGTNLNTLVRRPGLNDPSTFGLEQQSLGSFEVFDIQKAYDYYQNMNKAIYPKVNDYLTGKDFPE